MRYVALRAEGAVCTAYPHVIGAALNPRNGSFDWKFFCESRPG
ncbi:MAG: Ergosterol biosynthesis family, partial [Pseudomonadota bacterium]